MGWLTGSKGIFSSAPKFGKSPCPTSKFSFSNLDIAKPKKIKTRDYSNQCLLYPWPLAKSYFWGLMSRLTRLIHYQLDYHPYKRFLIASFPLNYRGDSALKGSYNITQKLWLSALTTEHRLNTSWSSNLSK